jgi:hypothetical protein
MANSIEIHGGRSGLFTLQPCLPGLGTSHVQILKNTYCIAWSGMQKTIMEIMAKLRATGREDWDIHAH